MYGEVMATKCMFVQVLIPYKWNNPFSPLSKREMMWNVTLYTQELSEEWYIPLLLYFATQKSS